MDDHWFLQRLREGTGGVMDLFVFITPDMPRDGWNLAPELKLAFWRPLAALTHQLDYALTDSVVAWHVHSWLWLLAAVAAGSALYRQVSPGWTGLLAAVMFAVEDAHAFPAAWLANRNALMCLAFGLVGIRWHHAGHRHRALLPLAACLLSAEAGVAAFAYIAAMEWRRPTRLLPHAALVVGWRSAYSALGYGAAGSGAYVDPFSLDFLAALVERFPVHVLVQFLHVPGEAWGLAEDHARQLVSGLGWLYLLGLVALFLPLLRRDSIARMWALGMLLSLIPACATLPLDRVLGWVGVGAFGLLARLPLAFEELSWTRRLKLAGLLWLHVNAAALLLPLRMVGVPLFENFIREPVEDVAFQQDDVVVFLTGNDISTAYLTGWRASEGLEGPLRATQLGSATYGAAFVRTGPRTLEMTTPPLMTRPMEKLTRAAPFAVGEVIEARDYRAEVLAVEDGAVTGLRFTFADELEAYRVLAFDGGALIQPELRVGGTLRLQAGVPGMD